MATALLRRLEQSHGVLHDMQHCLPSVPELADVLTAYELTNQSIQQFVTNTHTQWFNSIDPSLSKQLQANLLLQDKADGECQIVQLRYGWPATCKLPHVHVACLLLKFWCWYVPKCAGCWILATGGQSTKHNLPHPSADR